MDTPISRDAGSAARAMLRLALDVARVAMAERISFLAASIAYYAFVSIVPLLVLAIAIGSVIGGERAVEWLIRQFEMMLTPVARSAIRDALLGATGRIGAATASIVIFLWSGLRVFRGLDLAFSDIHGTIESDTFIGNVRNALAAFVTVGLGTAIVVGISAGLVLLPGRIPYWSTVSLLGLTLALIVVLLPLYVLFPGRPMTLGDALPGATVAAVGWTALGALFGVYSSMAATYAVYGVLGGILLLVTLFYFASMIILVGAVLNAILLGDIDPDGGPFVD